MPRKRKTVAVSSLAAGDEVLKHAAQFSQNKEKNSELYLGLSSQTGNPSAVGGMTTANNVQPNSIYLEKWKVPTASNETLRRSVRLKSLGGNQRAIPIVHLVDIDEVEKEEEPPESEKVDSPVEAVKEKSSEVETRIEQDGPQGGTNERSLNEMVSYLVRAVDEFKIRIFERPYEDPSPDVSYKSMYFSSQKKVETLMEEHCELVRKLEFAEGQIAAYKKMIDVMGAMKEVVFVSSLEKSTNGKMSFPAQAAQNCVPSTSGPGAGDDDRKHQKRSHKKRKA